jgi:hypothetical protein
MLEAATGQLGPESWPGTVKKHKHWFFVIPGDGGLGGPASWKFENDNKVRILSWKKDGMSMTEIAKRLGWHRVSIDCLWAKWKGLLRFFIPKCKMDSGRPKRWSRWWRRGWREQAVKFPQMKAAYLQNIVPELRSVSELTIQRTLHKDLKMPSNIAAQKPLLSIKMKAKRLKFAKAYRHWTSEDWSKVMYSESPCLSAWGPPGAKWGG